MAPQSKTQRSHFTRGVIASVVAAVSCIRFPLTGVWARSSRDHCAEAESIL